MSQRKTSLQAELDALAEVDQAANLLASDARMARQTKHREWILAQSDCPTRGDWFKAAWRIA